MLNVRESLSMEKKLVRVTKHRDLLISRTQKEKLLLHVAPGSPLQFPPSQSSLVGLL